MVERSTAGITVGLETPLVQPRGGCCEVMPRIQMDLPGKGVRAFERLVASPAKRRHCVAVIRYVIAYSGVIVFWKSNPRKSSYRQSLSLPFHT